MKNFFSISSSKKITDSPYPKTLVLEEVNHEKVADDNILDKLLRPPSLHEKKINSQPRKFDPKFMKPDNETLAQENLSLKLQMKQDKQTIMNMKFKLAENERKIKALETAQ